MHNEPNGTSERKQAFYAYLGRFSNGNQETRSTVTGLKSLEAWRQMFPDMFPDVQGRVSVNETNAQKLAAVYTCLNILGETLGSLPFDVKQNTKDGPVTAYKHPAYRLLHDRPNANMTPFTFWSTIWKQKYGWGNAYVRIVRDRKQIPVSLEIMEPWEVTLMEHPVTDEIYYKYDGVVYPATDVLHFKNYSVNGCLGLSTIRQNALTIGLGLKLNNYNSNLIETRPHGYLSAQSRPKDEEQKKAIRNMWERPQSTGSQDDVSQIGKIPLLYGGVEFKAFTLPAEDSAYIESAKMTAQDIYGMFRVPPTLAQNYEKAPYNSSEQQDIVFAKYSLQSIRDIEQEVNEKLFSEYNKVAENNYYSKFNLNGLLRGDMNARQQFYSSGINNGWLSPKQVAELEDLPLFSGGDVHMVNSTLIPLDQLKDWIDSKIQKNNSPSPGSGNNGDNTNNQIREKIREEIREEVLQEVRELIRPKLNGKWSEIEPLLQ